MDPFRRCTGLAEGTRAVSGVLLLILALLIVSLFVMAMIEASLLHVRRSAVAAQTHPGDRQGTQLLRLLDDLPSIMNAVLLAVLALQVTAASVAGLLAQRWFGGSGVTVATIVVTTLLFVYGEAIPKTIAIGDPVRYARSLSRVATLLSTALFPLVRVLTEVARWQSPGRHEVDTVTVVSEGELLHLTGEAAAAGSIDLSDAELIRKSFTLGDLPVASVMTPIDRVVSVAGATPNRDALRIALDAGHRRIPVHTGEPDRIVGFVRLRDVAEACISHEDRSIPRYIRETITTDRETLAIDLLRSMQLQRCHIAVVAEADGSAVGIVTVEDIVEELLGEIDEPDPPEDLRAGGSL